MKPRAREGGQRGFTLRVGRNGFRNRQGAESRSSHRSICGLNR
jgi:hypothetical protein